MCVRDSMKVYIRAEWLINVSSLSLVLLQETLCSGDVILQETFCYRDVLLRRRFVWRRFVEETFCEETFSM
jgi:hypothetical protein